MEAQDYKPEFTREMTIGKTCYTVNVMFSKKGKSLKEIVEQELILGALKNYQKTA